MPAILIYGIDRGVLNGWCDELVKMLQNHLSASEELGMSDDTVGVFFPVHYSSANSHSIHIIVQGLDSKPEIEVPIRQKLARSIGELVNEWILKNFKHRANPAQQSTHDRRGFHGGLFLAYFSNS
ncbi:MAG TPA: hypothetical protein VLG69_00920 [Candidatus Andersenbacteria bacterium]|nr:hypothetical protein [Candidatus Andersenbacteria bacterium]